jgi:hypothetical protein
MKPTATLAFVVVNSEVVGLAPGLNMVFTGVKLHQRGREELFRDGVRHHPRVQRLGAVLQRSVHPGSMLRI